MRLKKFEIDKDIFGRSALLRSGFSVTGRCYVSIETASNQNWEVVLKSRDECSEEEMERLEGEFRNALITESYRDTLLETSRAVKEMIVAKALFSAEGAGFKSVDSMGSADNQTDDEFAFIDEELDNYLDDPLGIAIPWEEKHSKTATEKDD